ncbi:MAG TPA: TonB-dependent receptor, partial [Bacteroidales bacterium]|nr:TonB-dependent receptor [Bacteroidales bacterium]
VVPGIETFGDGSSLFYVRGGSSDQNLILVDEVPMYNTSHLFGFLSVISPDAISDIEVFKGDFPAKYGGRISSVADIKTKDGNNRRIGFGGNVGPYTSSIYLEGPMVKNKSSFYIGGRLSTLQWLPKLYYKDQEINIGFFDLNTKFNFKINDKNRLFATFYIGNDLLERNTSSSIETYGLGWNNLLGTLRWNHVFSKKLFSNTTAYITRYQYLMYLSEDQREYWNSAISNITLKTDFTWFLNPRNTVTAGLSISSHGLDAGKINLNDNTISDPRDVPEYHNAEYTLYIGNDQKITEKLILRYGLRLPFWQNLGPATVYYFDDNYTVIDTFYAEKRAVYNSFASPEPRINLTWLVTAGSSLKAGYSRTAQFLHELNNNISPFTSLSVWVPSGPTIMPRKADQYSLGYFSGLFGHRVKFSAEAYYRHYYHYIDYTPHANMLYNPLIEGEVRQGDAWSYGLELMLHKTSGRLSGWIGYTYSRVFAKIPGVNDGLTYRAFHDRPHHLTIFMSYNTEKRWSFSANWLIMSGAAITTPESFYEYNGYVVPVYGEKNNDRLPPYHRLDLSANFRLNRNEFARYRHNLILSLFNVYGHSNPYFISFNRIENPEGDYVIPADHYNSPDIIPTNLSVSEIIPSVNYQFKF